MSKIVPMPWPVTHILTAELYYEPFFSHLDHRKFIIGTCYPDIRYPAGLPRKSTHIKDLSLSEIQSKSAFHAGLSFHSMIDEMWNAYVLHKNGHIFTEIPHNRPMIHAMKVLQDKYLYKYLEKRSQMASYFEDPLPEESAFGVNKEMIERWHHMLTNYLSKPPSVDDLAMLSISLKPDIVNKIEEYFIAYQDNQRLKRVLLAFYNHIGHFDQKMKSHNS